MSKIVRHHSLLLVAIILSLFLLLVVYVDAQQIGEPVRSAIFKWNYSCIWGGTPYTHTWGGQKPSVCKNGEHRQYSESILDLKELKAGDIVSISITINGVNGVDFHDIKGEKFDLRAVQITVYNQSRPNNIQFSDINSNDENTKSEGSNKASILVRHFTHSSNDYSNVKLEGGKVFLTIQNVVVPNDKKIKIQAWSPGGATNTSREHNKNYAGGYYGDSVVLSDIAVNYPNPPKPSSTPTPTPSKTPTPTPKPPQALARCINLVSSVNEDSAIVKSGKSIEVLVNADNAVKYRYAKFDVSTNAIIGQWSSAQASQNFVFKAIPDVLYRFAVQATNQSDWSSSHTPSDPANDCAIKFVEQRVYTQSSTMVWGDPYIALFDESLLAGDFDHSDNVIAPNVQYPQNGVKIATNLKNNQSMWFTALKYKDCNFNAQIMRPDLHKYTEHTTPYEHIIALNAICDGANIAVSNIGHISHATLGGDDLTISINGSSYTHQSMPKGGVFASSTITIYPITYFGDRGFLIGHDEMTFIVVQQMWRDGFSNRSGLLRVITNDTVNPDSLDGYFAEPMRRRQPKSIYDFSIN
jgi:hypothetical protein